MNFRVGAIDFDEPKLFALLVARGGLVSTMVEDNVEEVAEVARQLTNDDMVGKESGELHGSIGHRMTESGNDAEGEVFANAAHAIHVHDGTWRHPARPFLATALEEVLGVRGFF